MRGVAGRQKAPFSAEFLTAAASIDFVNRARIVNAVAPGRTTGVQLRATPSGGPVSLRVGVFNATQVVGVSGNCFSQRQRGGALLAARAQSQFDVSAGSVTVGANVAYNTDDTSDQVASPGKLDLGVDARVRVGRFLVAGEFLRSRVEEPYVPTQPTGLDGGYVTLGVDLTPDDRVLARLDVIGVEDQQAATDLLIGYNRAITRAASVQANVVVPIDKADAGYDSSAQALFNLQLAF